MGTYLNGLDDLHRKLTSDAELRNKSDFLSQTKDIGCDVHLACGRCGAASAIRWAQEGCALSSAEEHSHDAACQASHVLRSQFGFTRLMQSVFPIPTKIQYLDGIITIYYSELVCPHCLQHYREKMQCYGFALKPFRLVRQGVVSL